MPSIFNIHSQHNQNMSENNKFTFLTWVLFILTTIIGGIIIWGMNKGFDITDEGYYLLSYQKEFVSDIDVRFHQNIVKLIFFWIDLNTINVRIIRFCLTIFSSLIFSFGF